MIKVITSKDNSNVKFALSLKDNKNRKKYGMFLAEGKKALEMALKNKHVEQIFTTEWIDVDESINQLIVSEDIIKKLASTVNPEGIVFISKIREFKGQEFNKILYLDEINDPGNLGTLIRTALAFSYDAVITSENSCSIYNEKVINSSKGSIFSIPVFVGNLNDYKNTHEIIVSALEKDAVNYDEIKVPNKFVLVLGNESHGVKKSTLEIAKMKVIIPIANIDSLNVAIAGAIIMSKIH